MEFRKIVDYRFNLVSTRLVAGGESNFPSLLVNDRSKSIIWRVDARVKIKYMDDCLYVDDLYLERMRKKIIDEKLVIDGPGNIFIEEVLNEYKDLGYFVLINNTSFCYNLETLYDKIEDQKKYTYSEWMIKRLLE